MVWWQFELHDVFHVSQLRKHIYNLEVGLQVEKIDFQPNMMFEVQPLQVLERQNSQLRYKVDLVVKKN